MSEENTAEEQQAPSQAVENEVVAPPLGHVVESEMTTAEETQATANSVPQKPNLAVAPLKRPRSVMRLKKTGAQPETDKRYGCGLRGMKNLKRRLVLEGIEAVDRRSPAARAYTNTRAGLLEHLGGAEAASETQLQLVELVARGLLYLGHVDALLLERRNLLTKRRTKLIPLVGERMRMSEILSRQLQALGLEPRPAGEGPRRLSRRAVLRRPGPWPSTKRLKT